eukprot:7506693-Alexandrium_andersonii.AAC.1
MARKERTLVLSPWTAVWCARCVSHAWFCVSVLVVWWSGVERQPESARLGSSELRECESCRRKTVGV